MMKRLVLIIVICCACASAVPAGANDEARWPVLIPEVLVGPWYSKLVYGEKKPRTCDDLRTKLRGIRIFADGKVTALNGAFSCRIVHMEYSDYSSYHQKLRGVWSYEKICKLHSRPTLLSGQKSEWKEFGDFKLFDRDGLELSANSSDRKASSYFFGDKNQGSSWFMTYLQCP